MHHPFSKFKTFDGSEIFSTGESLNANFSIVFNSEFSANSTLRRFLQLENELSPIKVTCEGIKMCSIPEGLNAHFSII